ncbi:creatininase family protein [uncultured Sphaerochaeta sp.]|uniref:creatininase family protein n=1 Tax=uncultured Sphaerochaeta sp. TaxID=886478 RepID=UPI002A0A1391|nr:creatininase family protein [uncultured Sphaerochaeta sp.]
MYLSNVTWPKAEQYFKQSDMVIIPIGSIECHGRHMPLGTDTMIPDKILELVEKQNDHVMIIPTIPYGACESLWPFPGTINLGSDLLYQLVKQIVMNLKRHGARKFLVLNGHGGNIKALERIGLELDSQGCMMALLNWWQNVWEMNPSWKGGHGGGEETAAVLAIDPGLVDKTQIELPLEMKDVSATILASGFNTVKFKDVTLTIPRLTNHITDNGWIGTDHPKYATEAWGTEMLQAMADYIVSFIEEFEKVTL